MIVFISLYFKKIEKPCETKITTKSMNYSNRKFPWKSITHFFHGLPGTLCMNITWTEPGCALGNLAGKVRCRHFVSYIYIYYTIYIYYDIYILWYYDIYIYIFQAGLQSTPVAEPAMGHFSGEAPRPWRGSTWTLATSNNIRDRMHQQLDLDHAFVVMSCKVRQSADSHPITRHWTQVPHQVWILNVTSG